MISWWWLLVEAIVIFVLARRATRNARVNGLIAGLLAPEAALRDLRERYGVKF